MARPPSRIAWLPAALTDLVELDAEDEKLADAVLAAVDDLAHHRQRRKALGRRTVSGDLTGLLRLRFDVPGRRPQRYRVVYRLTSAETSTIEIIAVGLRADHQIYRQAAARTVPRPRDG